MAAPQEGSRVLDCCSAPGGKSFTAAMLMHNRGEIISCDIHPKKLALVEEGARRLGINIIETRQANASVFNPEFENAFDLVVADVPCSGLGVIRKKPEIRFKTEQEISDLPEIQKKILDNVSHYVNQNGKLLYSTCTVMKEENEYISHSLSGFEIIDEKTFWPNIDGTDGFYAMPECRSIGRRGASSIANQLISLPRVRAGAARGVIGPLLLSEVQPTLSIRNEHTIVKEASA